MRVIMALLIGLAAPAATSQELVFDEEATAACVAVQQDDLARQRCVGRSANACMELTDGGMSTVGMAGCLDREWSYWDMRLNAAYATVRTQARAMDREIAEYSPEAAKQADALRDMQRVWIVFRDRFCDYERSLWGGGTGGGPASIGCLMQETARQALYLESREGMG